MFIPGMQLISRIHRTPSGLSCYVLENGRYAKIRARPERPLLRIPLGTTEDFPTLHAFRDYCSKFESWSGILEDPVPLACLSHQALLELAQAMAET